MNLEKLNVIVETANVAGINRLVINKTDERVMIYGSDDEGEEPSIVIISEADWDVVDNSIGIHRVPVLLNRMNLFSLDKATVSKIDTDNYTKSITIKEGRKKVSYTFADPSTLSVPTDTIDDSIICTVRLTKDNVQNLVKANQAITPKLFTLSGIKDDIQMELFDGISDTLTDVIGKNTSGDWSFNWEMSSVMKLVRHAIKQEDSVELGIGGIGILYITVNDLIFMVMPQVL